jgi:hypothetical protein
MSKHRLDSKNPPPPIPVAALSEQQIESIESDPEFQRMIEQSLEDERKGRTYSNHEVQRMVASRRRRHS